jgi:hypothetical protein
MDRLWNIGRFVLAIITILTATVVIFSALVVGATMEKIALRYRREKMNVGTK